MQAALHGVTSVSTPRLPTKAILQPHLLPLPPMLEVSKEPQPDYLESGFSGAMKVVFDSSGQHMMKTADLTLAPAHKAGVFSFDIRKNCSCIAAIGLPPGASSYLACYLFRTCGFLDSHHPNFSFKSLPNFKSIPNFKQIISSLAQEFMPHKLHPSSFALFSSNPFSLPAHTIFCRLLPSNLMAFHLLTL